MFGALVAAFVAIELHFGLRRWRGKLFGLLVLAGMGVAMLFVPLELRPEETKNSGGDDEKDPGA
jgi:hypothetical protein